MTPSQRQTLADSILISLLAMALSTGSIALLFGDTVSDTVGEVSICGAPTLAILNSILVVRDYKAGRQHAAVAAALISCAAAFIAMLPLLLAD